MKPEIKANKIVVLSGAGISTESGLATYRDSNGLWQQYHWRDLASPEGWRQYPEAVLAFYNERRAQLSQVEPNAAHLAIAELEPVFDVIVITQNVDNLHERAGSKKVLHLHGELDYVRSQKNPDYRFALNGDAIHPGDLCPEGSQLRPDIVWFGENIRYLPEALWHIKTAARVLVVGSSLQVFPAASLLKHARGHAEKILVTLDIDEKPYGFKFIRGKATAIIPSLCTQWLAEQNNLKNS